METFLYMIMSSSAKQSWLKTNEWSSLKFISKDVPKCQLWSQLVLGLGFALGLKIHCNFVQVLSPMKA